MGSGDRGVDSFTEAIEGQQLVLGAGSDHGGSAPLVGNVDSAIRVNRRAPGRTATRTLFDLVLPQLLTGLPFVATGNTDIVVRVEIFASDDGTADIHRSHAVLQQLLADVAGAAELDQAGAVDRQAVDKKR